MSERGRGTMQPIECYLNVQRKLHGHGRSRSGSNAAYSDSCLNAAAGVGSGQSCLHGRELLPISSEMTRSATKEAEGKRELLPIGGMEGSAEATNHAILIYFTMQVYQTRF